VQITGGKVVSTRSHDKRAVDRLRIPAGELTVRHSVTADLPFIVRLSKRVFSIYGPYGSILGLSFLQNRVFTWVAIKGGRRAGFAMVSSKPEPVELTALAVREDHQGWGVGRRLLREAIEWARGGGARIMILNTATGNVKAQRLFLSEGFVVVGERQAYYPEGQTSLEMHLALEEACEERGV
jgi:ribosomal-protein-alanine N-acetyltransferase